MHPDFFPVMILLIWMGGKKNQTGKKRNAESNIRTDRQQRSGESATPLRTSRSFLRPRFFSKLLLVILNANASSAPPLCVI